MKLHARVLLLAASASFGTALVEAQFTLNRRPIGQAPANNAAETANAPSETKASEAPKVVTIEGNEATVEVTSDVAWIDSGLEFKANEMLKISAGGQLAFGGGGKGSASLVTPKGVARSFRDLMRVYPVNDAPRGALIGKFSDNPAARAFLIGEGWEGRVPLDGRLYLGINQTAPSASDGHFHVTLVRTPAPTLSQVHELPDFPQEMLDSIPRRVQDAKGTLGDRTNFVIVASRERVREAFERAGWSLVDADNGSAILSGILATLGKRSYVTLPMSILNLFDRGQDFGYAQGDPVMVVAERHHFRLWQAPFDLEGHTVWVGAGTHDIGFDKDQRTGGLTHKIDSEVDKEREYIVDSLQHTGLVVKVDYKTPEGPIRVAKTAHGQEFYSDGRTAIIYLQP